MNPFKSASIAFSRFSAVPQPFFEWRDGDLKYSMAFFPLIGAVIGGIMYAAGILLEALKLPDVAAALVLSALPMIISGGIHLDGYMDVMDARSSWKSKEEKLRILKDPHIGAFAVIHLAKIGLIYLAALLTVVSKGMIGPVCCCFVISRALSVIGIIVLRKAKTGGTLAESADQTDGARGILIFVSVLWIIAAFAVMAVMFPSGAAFAAAAAGISFIYYVYVSYRQFGGITGDLAGFFTVICEVNIIIGIAAAEVLFL